MYRWSSEIVRHITGQSCVCIRCTGSRSSAAFIPMKQLALFFTSFSICVPDSTLLEIIPRISSLPLRKAFLNRWTVSWTMSSFCPRSITWKNVRNTHDRVWKEIQHNVKAWKFGEEVFRCTPVMFKTGCLRMPKCGQGQTPTSTIYLLKYCIASHAWCNWKRSNDTSSTFQKLGYC